MEFNMHEKAIVFQKFMGTDKDLLNYVHNTYSEEIANKIINEGFIFEKYLENTSDLISPSQIIDIKYFLHRRRSYGNFTILIQIEKKIVENLSEQLNGTPFHYTEAITKKDPEPSPDGEMLYVLPEQYIKGFFNQDTLEIVKNALFDPSYNPSFFIENLNKLKSTIIKLQKKI